MTYETWSMIAATAIRIFLLIAFVLMIGGSLVRLALNIAEDIRDSWREFRQ